MQDLSLSIFIIKPYSFEYNVAFDGCLQHLRTWEGSQLVFVFPPQNWTCPSNSFLNASHILQEDRFASCRNASEEDQTDGAQWILQADLILVYKESREEYDQPERRKLDKVR